MAPFAMQTPSLILLIALPLIGWRLYRRFRRLVGRQTYHPRRPWITVVVFPLLVGLLGLGALHSPLSLEALGGGILAGIALALVGLRLTTFERSDEGLFFTPNAHIGIALTLVFVGRLLWRFFRLSQTGIQPTAGFDPQFGSSPWTLLIFGVLAAYYTTYALGLLRWRMKPFA